MRRYALTAVMVAATAAAALLGWWSYTGLRTDFGGTPAVERL